MITRNLFKKIWLKLNPTYRKINRIEAQLENMKNNLLYLPEGIKSLKMTVSHKNVNLIFHSAVNDPIFHEKVNRFRNHLYDQTSKEHLDRYIKKAMIMPKFNIEFPPQIKIPLNSNLFSDEDLIVLANHEEILNDLRKVYEKKYGRSEIPIHLHAHYYKCGMIYIPDRIIESTRDSVAIDGGAWVGDTAIMLNNYYFSKIHCFEPEPTAFEILKNNINKIHTNEQFTLYNKGLGEKSGSIDFYTGLGYLGNASSAVVKEKGTKKSIEIMTIDDLVSNIKERIGLIKIDVEGFEEQVLKGAEKTIIRDKPILLCAAYHEDQSPGQVFRIMDYLTSLNLSYKYIFRGMQPDSWFNLEYDLICYIDN
ncbi:MAG: FkbM family methyltransferase [Spirochaetaceae bacterium]|nr:FkbM family methyltransferase [Spirochaetaceae bacterium]